MTARPHTQPTRGGQARRRLTSADFDYVNRAALAALPAILDRWCPGGRVFGREWTGLNPKRNDRRPGSFRVNLVTGRWADFAVPVAGGDPISLAAYLFDLSQGDAARRLGDMLGVRNDR